jgi:lambda family phage portal protein
MNFSPNSIGGAIDRALGVVAPRVALRRIRSRAALDVLSREMDRQAHRFSYDAASSGRRANGWYASSADANVELMGSLIWMRNRSRDLVRNNPYAAKAVDELVGNLVGTGIVPRAKTGNADLDKLIDEEWPYFCENCDTPQRVDFYGMQALVTRSMVESGEMLVRFRPRLASDNLRVPLQLQMLESDFLDPARTMGLPGGNHVMQGVEFDQIGRRINYWLYSYHPGSVLILNPRGGIVSQPISANQVMHIYRVLRPGQVRGVPWLAPVMLALRDLEDYSDAERVRKKIEACMAGFVEQVEGADGDPLGLNKTTDAYNGSPLESFEPGMIKYLKPGQKVSFSDPKPVGGYREYKKVELQAIMAGIGLPYELGTGDMSEVNFSSWRGGMLGFRNTVENGRWLTLIPLFCMPARRRFIDTLILLGKIPAKAAEDPKLKLYSTQWTAPKFESVDPKKDADAERAQIRSGTSDLFEKILENGYDPMERLDRIQFINAELDRRGIILDSDPRNTTDKGQEQPADTEERTPSSKPAPVRNAKAEADEEAGRAYFRDRRSWQRTFAA